MNGTTAARLRGRDSRGGSVSAAARRLHLTQPTLSRQLRELEREVGTTLFERTGRGLAPTQAGQILVQRALTVLAQTEAALAAVRLAGQGLSGRLTMTFAAPASTARSVRHWDGCAANFPGWTCSSRRASTTPRCRPGC
ncbi:LysR family transcriptional regulator [Streptosporangium lutulentum]